MKICLVSSAGGHLTETLQLLPAFEGHEFFFVIPHSSRNDMVQGITRAHFVRNIGANPVRMFFGFFWAYRILKLERPDVIISLGAEIAIPFFYLGRLMGMKTLFIESWCRIHDLSKTAKLVYPIVDQFWVQWPQLLEACGTKAQYKGAVV